MHKVEFLPDGTATCGTLGLTKKTVDAAKSVAMRITDSTGAPASELAAELLAWYALGARAMLDALEPEGT